MQVREGVFLEQLTDMLRTFYRYVLARRAEPPPGRIALVVTLENDRVVRIDLPAWGVLPDPQTGSMNGIRIISDLVGPGFSAN